MWIVSRRPPWRLIGILEKLDQVLYPLERVLRRHACLLKNIFMFEEIENYSPASNFFGWVLYLIFLGQSSNFISALKVSVNCKQVQLVNCHMFSFVGKHCLFLLLGLTGRVEALAICSSGYLWCDPCWTKAALGGLYWAHLGYHTFNVSIDCELSFTSWELLTQ